MFPLRDNQKMRKNFVASLMVCTVHASHCAHSFDHRGEVSEWGFLRWSLRGRCAEECRSGAKPLLVTEALHSMALRLRDASKSFSSRNLFS